MLLCSSVSRCVKTYSKDKSQESKGLEDGCYKSSEPAKHGTVGSYNCYKN